MPTNEGAIIGAATESLRKLFDLADVDDGHGMPHALAVLDHARMELKAESTTLDVAERTGVLLAALLHDADDRKVFHRDPAIVEADPFPNATQIMGECGATLQVQSLVIEMISLVSCSKNRNGACPDASRPWLLLPRFCDRLEALGHIGIRRCHQVTLQYGQPLFSAVTLRASTREDLYRDCATPQRFAAYRGSSASLVDHFYDKILHIADMDTNNKYIIDEANRRVGVMEDFVLEFGRTGKVNMLLCGDGKRAYIE